MRLYEAAGIGIVMACLYGLILWTTTDALSTASFILYGNTTILPKSITFLIISIAFLFLFSYPYWATRLERMIVRSFGKEDEDE